MARIRTIKPEFWTNEQVMECSMNARLLFIGIWNFCDDQGRISFSCKQLKAQIFPADDISGETIRGMIDELSSNGLVLCYEVENKQYLQVTGWHHQRIDRPQPSKIPPIPSNVESTFDDHSKNVRDGREGKGKECKGEEKDKKENNSSQRGNTIPREAAPRRADDFLNLDLDHAEIESQLRKAAGLQSSTATALRDISPIIGLIERGIDLKTVILPAIQSHGKRETASSWKYFVGRIEERHKAQKNFLSDVPKTSTPIANVVLIKSGSKAFDAWRDYLDATGKRAKASMMRQGLVHELSVESEFPPALESAA